MKEIRNIIIQYDNIDHATEKVALASVVNVEESSYRRIGARMLVRSSGIWTGGISGGCLEGDALKRSLKAIFNNTPSKVVYDTMEDDNNQIGVGLGCNGKIEVLFTPIDPSDPHNEIEILRSIKDTEHPQILIKAIEGEDHLGKSLLVHPGQNLEGFCGISSTDLEECLNEVRELRKPKIYSFDNSETSVKILVEFIRPETKLIIVGDNYDIRAMLGIATELGWNCIVVGKSKKLSKEIYKKASKVLEYEDGHQLVVNDYTAIILMSHDYNHDKNLLPVFIEKKPAYIGMLGPKKRFVKMKKELALKDTDLASLYTPTGLEIGAESPEEIALSIASEIIAAFRNKRGGFLREKEGTIHDRE